MEQRKGQSSTIINDKCQAQYKWRNTNGESISNIVLCTCCAFMNERQRERGRDEEAGTEDVCREAESIIYHQILHFSFRAI